MLDNRDLIMMLERLLVVVFEHSDLFHHWWLIVWLLHHINLFHHRLLVISFLMVMVVLWLLDIDYFLNGRWVVSYFVRKGNQTWLLIIGLLGILLRGIGLLRVLLIALLWRIALVRGICLLRRISLGVGTLYCNIDIGNLVGVHRIIIIYFFKKIFGYDLAFFYNVCFTLLALSW